MNTLDDIQLKRYFHYLLKLNWSLKSISRSGRLYFDHFRKVKGKKVYKELIITKEQYYNSYEELLLHCEALLSSVAFADIKLFEILKEEFGFKIKNWKEHIAISQEMPSVKDIDNLFDTPSKDNIESSIKQKETKHLTKLNWNGNKNQLYYILRQLKECGLIGNTYDELVDFLHESVIGFENDNKETTRGALKRKKTLPKAKRISLDTGKEE